MTTFSANSMQRTRKRLAALGAGLVLGLSHAPNLLADDTEIFVQALPAGLPNVLLVLDTSGSMSSDVVIGTNYDPDIDYSAELDPTSACRTDRYYFTRNTSGDTDLPSCSPLETSRRFLAESFKCADGGNVVESIGFYRGRMAQWDENGSALEWKELGNAGGIDEPPIEERPVECAEDYGIHGLSDGSDNIYPTNGADGPWAAEESAQALDWAVEDDYTVYAGNFLNWIEAERDTVIASRLEVLKDVAEDVVTGISGVRMGVMRFSQDGDGGMVVFPVSDLDFPTKRNLILSIRNMEPDGITPLAESMYEAHQYYSGGEAFFGLDSVGNEGNPQPSNPSAFLEDGVTYESPITGQCQRNFIVLLTDGLPVGDTGADTQIANLAGGCDDFCLDEISQYMSENDMDPTGLEETQTVGTYTIGFFTDDDLLRETATATEDDSDYYVADNVEDLFSAFIDALEDIGTAPDTFSSPAISVDSFNRLTNRDDLYFSLFVPSAAPHWAGNVKKYKLGGDDGQTIVDASGTTAVTGDGLFTNSSRSFWTGVDNADGADVTAGGARNRLGVNRNLYTNLTGTSNVALTHADNVFDESNETVLASLLGVGEGAEFTALLNLLKGVDTDGNAVPIFGDTLHSTPVVVTFEGGTEELPNQMMFVTTNDGYLHALNLPNDSDDFTSPMEAYAFIPRELLSQLTRLRNNDVTNPASKAYGLDGPMSYWIENDNGNGVVESGENLYLYFGMRRGGSNYYAIKIPGDSPNAPELAWTINGGTGSYAELGQSWSGATVAKVQVGSFDGDALIIGGGYDASTQDVVGPPTEDAIGRAIFIVEATSGTLKWWAGNPVSTDGGDPNLLLTDMTNSIPSTIRALDTNASGYADRLYFGDMGGRIWRMDLSSDGGTGTVFADVGGEGDTNNRRFYYPPSVARVIDPTFGSFLTLSVGSGHRASPLSGAVDDVFYMMKDPDVFAPPRDDDGNITYRPTITATDLLDITLDTSPSVEALSAHRGWLLDMVDGAEKVLAPALTADNKVFFTSYVPGSAEPSCDFGGVLGNGRLYSVSLLSGAPVVLDDAIDPDNPTNEDRFQDLDRAGIAPPPVPVFTPPADCEGDDCDTDPDEPPCDDGDEDCNSGGTGNPTGCINPFSQVTLMVATQAVNPNICNAPVRTFWTQGSVGR